MSDFTPNTGQVKHYYVLAVRNTFVASTAEHEEEFDRWRAAETAFLVETMLLAHEVLGAGGVRIWLDHPQKRFGNQTPRTMLAAGQQQEVRAILEALADGVFS